MMDDIRSWLDRHALLTPDLDQDGFWEEVVQSSREDMSWEETIHVLSFIASSKTPQHPRWDMFAANVLMADHKDRTPEAFGDVIRLLQGNHDATGRARPLLDEAFAAWIMTNISWIEQMFRSETQSPHFPMNLFGWKTLYKSYLMRAHGRVVERPDHLWFRVALFLYREDRPRVLACFRNLRSGRYTHATPTLFYAGARRPQMASCFPWNAVVMTPHGGRPMGSIRVGDRVLSHHGKWRRVIQVHKDVVGPDRGWKRIEWKGGVLEATDDHPFRIDRGGTWQWQPIGEVDTTMDRLIHITEVLGRPTPMTDPETVAWADRLGSHLHAFRHLYSSGDPTLRLDEEDMDSLPDEALRAALDAYRRVDPAAVDSTVHLEFHLSEHAPSWILPILCTLLAHHRIEALTALRTQWQKDTDPYLCMWYEQWDCLLHPPTDSSTTIHDLATIHPDETVYTLGVEEDHSYVVQGWIAQNCFLLGIEDSLEGIFKAISDVAQISKWAGGVGIHVSNIRADRSYIYGTNGYSNGILPMIRLFNDTSRYIDQCLAADANVWTRERGWAPIASILSGEHVLTQWGVYEPVEKVVSHVVDEPAMLRVWVDGDRSVDVTAEHAFLMDIEGIEHAPDPEECSPTDPAAPTKSIYVPLSDWSSGDRPHAIAIPSGAGAAPKTAPSTGWTPLWATVLRLVLEHSPIIEDPRMWRLPAGRTMTGTIHPFSTTRELPTGESLIEWAAGVLFPWVWQQDPRTLRYEPSVPYEWLRGDPTVCRSYAGILGASGDPPTDRWWRTVVSPPSPPWVRFLESLWTLHRTPPQSIASFQKIESIPWCPDRHRVLYDLVIRNHPSYLTELGVAHNGGGKRNGAFAIYLEPWHADIRAFLHAKKNTGPEEERARDLFYGLWIPDLFMKRVISNGTWSLMCPKECPGLTECHSDEFERLYTEYEAKQQFKAQIGARELFAEMIKCQIETGTPYFLYKDTCNQRSNQKHLGTIRSSNLCVVGGTFLLTRDGHRPIGGCVGETVKIWNGETFVDAVPLQTTERSESGLLEIVLSTGKTFQCTPDHLFHVMDNDVSTSSSPCRAKDLRIGDRLVPHRLPPLQDLSPQALEDLGRVRKFVLQNAFRLGESYYLRSDDPTSLQELHLGLDLMGIPSCLLHGQSSPSPLLQIHLDSWKILNEPIATLILLSGSTRTPIQETVKCVIAHPSAVSPVFCVREPIRHTAVFQGVLTGQCTEIIEYSDASEYAVCNLASISLPACCRPNPRIREIVRIDRSAARPRDDPEIRWLLARADKDTSALHDDLGLDPDAIRAVFQDGRSELFSSVEACWHTVLRPVFDFDRLADLTTELVRNLNSVIDQNRYPTPETRYSNLRHRPIGIGVQGLADVFCRMKIPFDAPDARALNRDIFETLYFTALRASCALAEEQGRHASFEGSPLSVGIFHWEMTPERPLGAMRHSAEEWDALRGSIRSHGVRNSLLIAPMPTASTSQILSNNECFEPYTSNFYTRRTSVGEFLIYNRELFSDMNALGCWTTTKRQELVWNRGSVQNLDGLPDWIRKVYRTVWEIPQKSIIDMAADRQFFIDQSQSLNLFLAEPNLDTLTKMHIYGWKKGLKTGSYYIRSRPPIATPHFALDPSLTKTAATTPAPAPPAAGDGETAVVCPRRRVRPPRDATETVEEEDVCMACSA